MKSLLIVLVLLGVNLALAAPRVQTVTMTIEQNQKNLILEVQTEDKSWHELSFYIYKPGSRRDFVRRIVPPSEPGLYRLEYTFADYGSWEINLRYGTGLDRYYGWINLEIDESSKNFIRRNIFQGDLDRTAPRYIQSIGFAIFGLLLLISLVLIGAILRWLSHRHHITV